MRHWNGEVEDVDLLVIGGGKAGEESAHAVREKA
jgi:succinate dehydrogenase/fumarate reductase flavoprotein subunit